ncbi:MAG TPA: hypothetical protein VIC34_10215 [Croceibacterium sp.]|jgi:hypothetical protein
MKLNVLFAVAATVTLTLGAAAQAAPKLPDMSGDEAAALAVYSVPDLISATRQTCAGRLSPNGFLAMRGDALSQRYAAQQNAVWPQARAALFKFAAGKAGDQLKSFSTLPDNAIRPLADALIQQEVALKIHPGSCRNVERLMEAVAPLEPQQAGTILSVLFDFASASDKLVASLESHSARP